MKFFGKIKCILNKKAFTLIEIIGTLVIVSILVVVSYGSITNKLKESNDGLDKATRKIILSQAEDYINKNINDFPSYNGNVYCIPLQSLVDEGLLDADIKNVRTGEPYDLTSVVEVVYEGNVAKEFSVVEKSSCKLINNMPAVAYNDNQGLNAPNLIDGMSAIKFNGTVWDGVSDSSSTYDIVDNGKYVDSWYSYADFNWANAVTADGSYWVWIPRYAYKITSGFHLATTGTIDVKFLKGTTNEMSDGNIADTVPTYTGSVQDNYIVHPAFNFGGTPVEGIWVAKFEPSPAEGTDNANGFVGFETNLIYDNVFTKTIQIKPGHNSWRGIQNYTAFKNSRDMETSTIYGFDGTGDGLDTHAAKNSEWGAITYLTMSQFGKTGNPFYDNTAGLEKEIWTNPTDSDTNITGCAGNTYTEWATATCNNFSTVNGVKASSTGTIYGIYDLASGWEVTMAVYDPANVCRPGEAGFCVDQAYSDANGNRPLTPSIIEASEGGKYIDLYYVDPYDQTETLGHALYEISSDTSRGTYFITWIPTFNGNTWYQDGMLVPNNMYPWFSRSGGYNQSGTKLGMFMSGWNFGKSSQRNSFRPVLMVEEGI